MCGCVCFVSYQCIQKRCLDIKELLPQKKILVFCENNIKDAYRQSHIPPHIYKEFQKTINKLKTICIVKRILPNSQYKTRENARVETPSHVQRF